MCGKNSKNRGISFHKIERNAFIGPRDRSPSTIFGRRASGRHRCPVSRASSCERVARDESCVGRRPNPTSVLRSRLTLLEREFRRARRIQFWVLVPVSGASRDPSGAACWSVARVRSLRATPLLRSPSDSLPSVLRKTMSVPARSWMCRRACSERSGETSSRDDHDCTSRE